MDFVDNFLSKEDANSTQIGAQWWAQSTALQEHMTFLRTAIPFSRGSSQSRDSTGVSYIAGRFLPVWATRKLLALTLLSLK